MMPEIPGDATVKSYLIHNETTVGNISNSNINIIINISKCIFFTE